jgi:hydrogenase maturation protease
MKDRPLVIGIGNRSRGDDGAGIEAARRLQSAGSAKYDISETDGEPTKLMDMWEGYHDVIAIDAVVTGLAPVGTVYCWDVSSHPLPTDSQVSSSHALGLSEAIELARVLEKLPAKIRVIGIEAEQYDYVTALSSPVESAVEKIVKTLSKEIGDFPCTNFHL